ncbi:MAG TPA: peptide-methionine (S)-S-oxide reductase MsrA [Gemmatimonadales bacterium]|nr:peptide-methionine (S)-S-oxide reductase MsrA [Gemmatimonadales bacterium]
MYAVLPILAALLPTPPASAPNAAPLDTAVLAGGCFWGVEGIFEHVKGVVKVVSGYAGGTLANPTSAQVYNGGTGHAESVMIIYDPARVSFDQLLLVFFNVAHDPTQLNRQGPDVGADYRSIAFYRDSAQQQSVEDAIASLQRRHVYSDRIVTEVVAFRAFYPAEPEHQGFMQRHLSDAYVVTNDLPKLDILKTRYASLYRAEWHD